LGVGIRRSAGESVAVIGRLSFKSQSAGNVMGAKRAAWQEFKNGIYKGGRASGK